HALGPRPVEPLGAGVGLDLGRDARLAHAGVTGDQDDRTTLRPSNPTEHLADPGDLFAAPDERTGSGRMRTVGPHQSELAGERVEMHDGGLAAEHHRPAVVDLQTVAPAAAGRL